MNNLNPVQKKIFISVSVVVAIVCSIIGYNYGKKLAIEENKKESIAKDSLTEDQKRLAKYSLTSLKVADGLELTSFATEPQLINPTNIDVDANGRVWVCEAYNYRPDINGNPTKKEGDRIIILEDTNADGKADVTKTFYQGPEINSPLGIAVLGNKVYVSQSPYIWIFTDENGDDKADKKEILFQGIEGQQHDHGAHAVTFGPDGKLYFNLGNEGKQLKDKNGKIVVDIDGKEISPKNYKQGLALRCNLDGSDVEVLGQNFRNNYELAVDSYGTIWQSDNDDDGNKATRINYVMQHGNYGYTSEINGAGWRASRVNQEDSIPLKHWHLNDPGVIPNLLQTGAGSPTGIIVYEGTLLPKSFQNQIIHCDAGPNVVRSYPVVKDGAGYKASINVMVDGSADQWFRPADVCAAPDGSLYIADWYDPGVGGHDAGDQSKGRIYRLAPNDHKYTQPKNDFNSIEGNITALQSPNQATRFLAYQNLKKNGATAIPALEKLYSTALDSRIKARAFWLLTETSQASKYINEAAKSQDYNLRIAAVRAANVRKNGLIATINQLVNDPEIQVRRECAIQLRKNKEPQAANLWAKLAQKHVAGDRWNVEALGIGATEQNDAFFKAYISLMGDIDNNSAAQDVIWRSRSQESLPFLASLATNAKTDIKDRLRYFRAFDFINSKNKSKTLFNILEQNKVNDPIINEVILSLLSENEVKNNTIAQNALKKLVNSMSFDEKYLGFVEKFKMKDQTNKILDSVKLMRGPGEAMLPAKALISIGAISALKNTITKGTETEALNTLQALRWVGGNEAFGLLKTTAENKTLSASIRKKAYRHLGDNWNTSEGALALLRAKKVPKEYIPAIVEGISSSWMKKVRDEARSYLGQANGSSNIKLPSILELTKLKGDATKGVAIYKNYCATCHVANGQGMDFGPNLSKIGAKLTWESLYTSIIHPDLGISFNYEGWNISMKDGNEYMGIIASKTETDIILKMPGNITQNLKTSAIKSMKKMENSMMPAGFQESMTTQELVDLTTYLKNLK